MSLGSGGRPRSRSQTVAPKGICAKLERGSSNGRSRPGTQGVPAHPATQEVDRPALRRDRAARGRRALAAAVAPLPVVGERAASAADSPFGCERGQRKPFRCHQPGRHDRHTAPDRRTTSPDQPRRSSAAPGPRHCRRIHQRRRDRRHKRASVHVVERLPDARPTNRERVRPPVHDLRPAARHDLNLPIDQRAGAAHSSSAEPGRLRGRTRRSSSSMRNSASSRPCSACRDRRPLRLSSPKQPAQPRFGHSRRSTACSGWPWGSCSASGSPSCATPSTHVFALRIRSALCWDCRCSPACRRRLASFSATAGW